MIKVYINVILYMNVSAKQKYYILQGFWLAMKPLAVDIVLLPSAEIMKKAVAVNKRLGADNLIPLDVDTCLPHISLCMGVCRDVEALTEVLKPVSSSFSSLDLKITGIDAVDSSQGEKISSLHIEENDALQQLHEQIMRDCFPLLTSDASKEMFCTTEVNDSSVEWVRNYKDKASFENFWPHITLGVGDLKESIDLTFRASRLAICHLGNYCTCRKVLATVDLKSNS